MSVGYATIYGDMNGGFNPIKDLYKMQVFRLCHLRNRWKPAGAMGPDGEVIPVNIIVKPPTAELRENQKDQDSLPTYEVLDDILECLVEKEMRVSDIVARGHELDVVKNSGRLLYLAYLLYTSRCVYETGFRCSRSSALPITSLCGVRLRLCVMKVC